MKGCDGSGTIFVPTGTPGGGTDVNCDGCSACMPDSNGDTDE